jgi:hypothetical protein
MNRELAKELKAAGFPMPPTGPDINSIRRNRMAYGAMPRADMA